MSEQQQKMRIGLVISGETFSLPWVGGFADLIGSDSPHDFVLLLGYASVVHAMRHNAAEAALAQDPPLDYLLWFDDDNPPSAQAAAQLIADLEGNSGIDLVAGWYRMDTPFQDASFGRSFKVIGEPAMRRIPADLEDFLSPDAPDVQEIDWTGFGAVLMRRATLETVGAAGFHPIQEGDAWLGEDIGFCKLAKAAGLRLFVDRRVKLQHLKLRDITG